MKHNPNIHHRRSIRLKGYDYSWPGAYFITICTQDRQCLFGKVVGGEMWLNHAGAMAERWWQELNRKFRHIQTDVHIVMPNHVHGIIVIQSVGADLRVCPYMKGAHIGAPLPEIVQWFKTMTTNEYIRRVKNDGWPPFPGRLWQRNYYEHVIRDDQSLYRIRNYILENPLLWHLDRENPSAVGDDPDWESWV